MGYDRGRANGFGVAPGSVWMTCKDAVPVDVRKQPTGVDNSPCTHELSVDPICSAPHISAPWVEDKNMRVGGHDRQRGVQAGITRWSVHKTPSASSPGDYDNGLVLGDKT
jgi:hypothetical protein